MSAPGTDQSLSSISSSGQVDGLGRRVLAFDRETGVILERLHLRPEVAVFESAIRERIDQLGSLEDERFARPGSIERDPATGELTVLSEFVAGSRLSDLLETAEEGGLVPGVDVALGFLLEALPAIGAFHAATGFAHGLIAPPRTVLTPAGQVVFLDPAFGAIVERLGLSRARLWTLLEIAAPPGRGPVRLDWAADVAQVALSAVMLVIGRRLREHEYPDALPALVSEVVEVAQIRGSSLFATTLERLLQRALPLGGSEPPVPADELASDIRQILRREIGTEVCRKALLDFTEQMDAAFSSSRVEPLGSDDVPVAIAGVSSPAAPEFDLDRLTLEALETLEVLDVEDPEPAAGSAEDDEDTEFEEIPLESALTSGAELPPPSPEPEPVRFDEFPSLDEPAAASSDAPAAESASEPSFTPAGDLVEEDVTRDDVIGDDPPAVKEVADPWSFDPAAAERAAIEAPADPAPAVAADAAPDPLPADTPIEDLPAMAADEAASDTPAVEQPASEPALATTPETAAPAADASLADQPAEPQPTEAPAPEEYAPASPRRKKRQHKSARARKDKLRSAAETKQQPESKPRTQGGWLVNPDRAAAFAPPVPEPPAPQPPPVIGHPAPAPVPIQPAVPPPQPVAPAVVPAAQAPAPRMPVYGAPPPVAPAPVPVAPVTPPPAAAPAPALRPPSPAGAPLRLKEQPPVRRPRPPADTYAVGYGVREPRFESEPERRFPWKLALILLVIVAAAIAIGRAYLPSAGEADPEEAQAAASPEPAVVVMPKIETGHISIETQPPGARVLLDGKAVGESPLKLADVPVGRHTLTFISSSGRVTRTVEVEAGRTAVVDASIFSGWVSVLAPVVLDVAVNGRSIGTTARERLMLSPGRYELTLTNEELGYKTLQIVQVEPGEVRTVRLNPRGPVSFNAIPWAEVWLGDEKLGETPLANVQVPIGTQVFVFRHPEHGERKVTVTVRASGTEAVSVDFTRSSNPNPDSQ